MWPEAHCDLAPIADGGEGFAESLKVALGGEWITVASEDALGRPIDARYAWMKEEHLAILEMSEASGLHRIAPAERDPLRSDTFGTGMLMLHATAKGARRILVGLGGSATTDAGTGMARALGFRFADSRHATMKTAPGNLRSLAQIERPSDLHLPEVIAASDVKNPLLGQRGAACVYGPQKGADPDTVKILDDALSHVAEICAANLGCDLRNVPGAGAARRLGIRPAHFC